MIDRRRVVAGLVLFGAVRPSVAAEDPSPERWARATIDVLWFRSKGIRVARYSMKTDAMRPTVARSDEILADRRPLPLAALAGEIVVVEVGGISFIRRVFGLPGERIAMAEWRPVIAGRAIEWTEDGWSDASPGEGARLRIFRETHPERPPHRVAVREGASDASPSVPDFVVPDGHVWLLGDLRDAGADVGRSGLPVPTTAIRGRVIYRSNPSSGWLVPPETVAGVEDE